MELCFARELGGEGLFGRFLHSIGQNYTLARAVVAREAVSREAIRAAVARGGGRPGADAGAGGGTRHRAPAIPRRDGAFAPARGTDSPRSGPRRPRDGPSTPDACAARTPSRHAAGHRRVLALLGAAAAPAADARGSPNRPARRLPTSISCIPRGSTTTCPSASPAPYAAPAHAKRPGGRLLLGNLVETPDSTWIMDYVWGWPLVYRTDADDAAIGRRPLAASRRVSGITRDATGRCLFLDVTKPRLSVVERAAGIRRRRRPTRSAERAAPSTAALP